MKKIILPVLSTVLSTVFALSLVTNALASPSSNQVSKSQSISIASPNAEGARAY
nr:hypothetical protein [Brevibacillus laterosporus]